MANYDSIDLDWTWDGDYVLGDDGDIKDTSYDLLQSLRNELRSVLRSEFSDWELHPNLGANISEFRGEPNTREIGAIMEDRIRSKILSPGIVEPGDIQVKLIPVSSSTVMINILIQAAATPANNLTVGEPLAVTLLYDSLEDSVFFLAGSRAEIEYRGS